MTHQGGRSRVVPSLDPGLQVSRRVEILALVPATASLHVVHANDDTVLVTVHHAGLQGVRVTTVTLPACAVPTLELAANLREQ